MVIRGGASALALCATLGAAFVVPPAPPGYTVVADHLNNPRQVTVHGGALYVAEAGTGGAVCPVTGLCLGFSGSVTRVHQAAASRVQAGLLSLATPAGEVLGVEALAFDGAQLYAVVSGSCSLSARQVPAAVVAQAGKVLELLGSNGFRSVGNVAGRACARSPAGRDVPVSDPYGLAATGGALVVADAAAGEVVRLPARGGVAGVPAARAVALSGGAGPRTAPTAVTVGPDGATYVGTMGADAGPGGAAVYRLAPGASTATVYASGLTAVTGLAFDADGTLYVCEWTSGFGRSGPSPDGDVVAIRWGSGGSARKVLGAGMLHFPGGVAVMDGSVYVSNWSIAPGQDGLLGPGAHGQLVRLD
jgi:hypothetical protein